MVGDWQSRDNPNLEHVLLPSEVLLSMQKLLDCLAIAAVAYDDERNRGRVVDLGGLLRLEGAFFWERFLADCEELSHPTGEYLQQGGLVLEWQWSETLARLVVRTPLPRHQYHHCDYILPQEYPCLSSTSSTRPPSTRAQSPAAAPPPIPLAAAWGIFSFPSFTPATQSALSAV